LLRAGDTIENPVTGERIVFRKTTAETNGEAVVIECFVKPNGFVAKPHVHPSQDERFEVLAGSLMFKLDGKELPAGPGDRILVPAGSKHQFWNEGDEEAHFVCEIRPALKFEQLVETMFALAADGKTNKKGMPNPLRLAVIARETFDTVQLPFPPVWMQQLGLLGGSWLGRLVGYTPTYTPASPDASEEAAAA
jgi:quercetin dioxygenase-like cupin family protein